MPMFVFFLWARLLQIRPLKSLGVTYQEGQLHSYFRGYSDNELSRWIQGMYKLQQCQGEQRHGWKQNYLGMGGNTSGSKQQHVDALTFFSRDVWRSKTSAQKWKCSSSQSPISPTPVKSNHTWVCSGHCWQHQGPVLHPQHTHPAMQQSVRTLVKALLALQSLL